jgi:hypothetical protein
MLDPRGVIRLARALAAGFRGSAIRGSVLQQGGTFVIGPGDRVHLEWRDRFSGDAPSLERVIDAIPGAGAAATRRTP